MVGRHSVLGSLLLFGCEGAADPAPDDGSGGAGAASASTSAAPSVATATSASASTGSAPGSSTTGGSTDCSDLPLCDDFEDVAVGDPPSPTAWTVTMPDCSGTGTLSVTEDQAHGGARSVKVDGDAGYCNHVFMASAAPATLGPALHARFWIRFASPFTDAHTTFLAMRDDADGGADLRMGGQNQVLMFNRESDDATLPAMSPAGVASSVTPEPGMWHCVQLAITSEGSIQTWVDGAEVSGLRIDGVPTPDIDEQWLTSDPSWQPTLGDFKLGWESYGGAPMELWIDDVALAASPVSCD